MWSYQGGTRINNCTNNDNHFAFHTLSVCLPQHQAIDNPIKVIPTHFTLKVFRLDCLAKIPLDTSLTERSSWTALLGQDWLSQTPILMILILMLMLVWGVSPVVTRPPILPSRCLWRGVPRLGAYTRVLLVLGPPGTSSLLHVLLSIFSYTATHGTL